LTIDNGGSLIVEEGGQISVLNEQGDWIAGFNSPWAVDSNGISVPTHFEVSVLQLVQVVEHRFNSEIVYPVTIDPWLGTALISYTRWSGNSLQVFPTQWGRTASTASRWAAWDEVLVKTPGNRENTPSMRDQLYCHVDFVRLKEPNKTSWNLDLARPYVNYIYLVSRMCNA
jgi:hypothetical protein